MSHRSLCLVILLLATLCAPASHALAVAYYPLVHHEPGEETLARPGTTVYLFHSGTEEVRALLHPGDVLAIYRTNPSCDALAVGKVRVVALLGENYLEAVVIEGSVKINDIAKQGMASFLVLAAQPCDRK